MNATNLNTYKLNLNCFQAGEITKPLETAGLQMSGIWYS